MKAQSKRPASAPAQPRTVRVLSLGAGVQSSTLLLMAVHGEIQIDRAIFADTQSEPAAAGRRTIVTSNLLVSDGALEAHIGPRTWDRIRGNADVLELTGESLR